MHRYVLPILPALTAALFAQTAPPEGARHDVIFLQRDAAAAAPAGPALQYFQKEIAPPGPGAGPMMVQLLGAEMSVEQVKGAPYSAQGATETTQVLADGNRIHRTTTASVWRDSEGRTRREQVLGGIGPLAPPDGPTMVFIADPVAGVSYTLDPRARTARKMPSGAAYRTASSATFVRKSAAGPADVVVTAARPQFRNEPLGKQVIEGVEAEGTRTVMTIPAGEIGNERPIEIVSEQWVSPELKVVVMSRHNDPRTGETVYRLTNINRAEPPHNLFEVPPDYTLAER